MGIKMLVLIATLGFHTTWAANSPYYLVAEAEKGPVRLQFTSPSVGEIGEVRIKEALAPSQ